jgi:TorA maturation chaperone TorD
MTVALDTTVTYDTEASAGTAARTARERSGLYGFLAEVFRAEPSPYLLKRIQDERFAAVLEAAGAHLGEELTHQPEVVLLEDLAVEYTRLFLGPGRHVRPYAATYLDGAGASLCGPTTVWVRNFMETAGFALTPEHRDLPDHVSVELEFMARMAAQEAEAIEAGEAAAAAQCRDIQKEFLETHLGRWLPRFCGHAAEHAELSFYRELARLVGHFLDSELASFAPAQAPA